MSTLFEQMCRNSGIDPETVWQRDCARYDRTVRAMGKPTYGWRFGFKLQLGGLWVGAHYSKYNRRLCVNLIPCLTVWICLPGGKTP